MQIGGGIDADNCLKYLSLGASHVIVTSFIFHDGRIEMDNLSKLVKLWVKKDLCLILVVSKRTTTTI